MSSPVVENSFKKDLKRVLKRGCSREKLEKVVAILMRGEKLPVAYRPHKLTGEWDGFWECHIESDWLLIYSFIKENLVLVRTGSHADLFE